MAAGLDAEIPLCSLCVGECYGAVKLRSYEEDRTIALMLVPGFLCVRGRFLHTARADALMY